MADSGKESKDNKRKRGAAAKKEKDREKDRPAPAPPMQDIKLPDKYRLLPVPKADAANAQPDDVVQLSRTAKAPQITLQDDMLTAGGCKGYRMVRATHGVASGSWYYEVKVNTPHNGEDGHTRLGWCTAALTRTSRGLRTAHTGHACQPPACCTYRRHRAACSQGAKHGTYGVRAPPPGGKHRTYRIAPLHHCTTGARRWASCRRRWGAIRTRI